MQSFALAYPSNPDSWSLEWKQATVYNVLLRCSALMLVVQGTSSLVIIPQLDVVKCILWVRTIGTASEPYRNRVRE